MNINSTCNAFWNGSTINFYRSGGGCRNTGELAAVFVEALKKGFGVYLAANVAYLYLIPVGAMRTSTLVAADAAIAGFAPLAESKRCTIGAATFGRFKRARPNSFWATSIKTCSGEISGARW